jgi:hypothetical protein
LEKFAKNLLNVVNFHQCHENRIKVGQISSSNVSKSGGEKQKNFRRKTGF